MFFIHSWQSPQAIVLLIMVFFLYECCIAQAFWRMFRAREVYNCLVGDDKLPSADKFIRRYFLTSTLAFIIFSVLTMFMRTNSPLLDYIILVVTGATGLVGLYQFGLHEIRKGKYLPHQVVENLKKQTTNDLSVLPHFRPYIIGFGFLMLILALMGPAGQEQTTTIQRQPFHIAMLIDLSQSMNTADILPTRLEAAKFELATLIETTPNDEYGIVYFTNDTFIQTPLAVDPDTSRAILRQLSTDIMPSHGTDFSAGLLAARELILGVADFSTEKNNTRRILLVSDGEDHSENLEKTLELLKNEHIHVDVIGFGTEAGGPVYTPDGQPVIYHDEQVTSRFNDDSLKHIATTTGGIYIRYTLPSLTAENISHQYDAIRIAVEPKGIIAKQDHTQLAQYFLYPVLLVGIYLIFEPLIGIAVERRRRRRHQVVKN